MLFNADQVDGFVERCLRRRPVTMRVPAHRLDFLPAGPVLVVSFEPAAAGRVDLEATRPAWAQALVRERGHTLLGVKREITNWYRSAELHRAFRALQAGGFFRDYQRVLFCGPSMGGYAALAFAASAPGCTVLALHPQSTLAPDRVWFDQRFAGAGAAAWQGDFVDGVDGAAVAARVYACYDPYQVKDRLHAQRLPSANLVRLRLPFVGHKTSQALHALGLLGPVLDGALDHSLDEAGFRRLARAREGLADYHCRLAERGRWAPRRQRHLARALTLQPDHPRAALLRRVWGGALGAAIEGDVVAAGSEDTVPQPARPMRWPAGVVTVPELPLVYLGVPQAAQDSIHNLLLYTATGRAAGRPRDALHHPALRRGRDPDPATHALITRQLNLGALVFTFVRDPGRRAYACFNAVLAPDAPPVYAAVREALQRDWGLRLPPPGEPPALSLRQENFAAFLRFVQANLAGDTALPRNPHWCPQAPLLAHYRKFLKIDIVGRVENFKADMAQVLHKAGVHRIPNLTQPCCRGLATADRFEDMLSDNVQACIVKLYEPDYLSFKYPQPIRRRFAKT